MPTSWKLFKIIPGNSHIWDFNERCSSLSKSIIDRCIFLQPVSPQINHKNSRKSIIMFPLNQSYCFYRKSIIMFSLKSIIMFFPHLISLTFQNAISSAFVAGRTSAARHHHCILHQVSVRIFI